MNGRYTISVIYILILLLTTVNPVGAQTAGQLKVMTFNIWDGGRHTGEEEGPGRVVDIIRDAGADIVTMQETYGSGERIAKALGYHLYLRSTNLSIMSRYPIIDTLDAHTAFNSGAVTIDVAGQPVVVSSNWLNYPFDYWDMLEKGETVDSVYWQQQFAGEKNTGILQEILNVLYPAIANTDNVPVIIAGDFNSGSHLDWVAETRQFNNGYVMPFPATRLMEQYGFTDSFREIHPDPLAVRGITWTPANPDAFQDRIDYIFYRGKVLEAIDSKTVNTHAEQYPSDHAAVITTFNIQKP